MYSLNLFQCKERADYISKLVGFFSLNSTLDDFHCGNEARWEDSIVNFIGTYGIEINREYHKEIFISSRHKLSTIDNLKSIKKYGMINLKDVLTKDTSLNFFLSKHKIIVDVDNKKLNYHEIPHPILNTDEKCKNEDCVYLKKDCWDVFDTTKYEYQGCEYREALEVLEDIIVHDKCELEVFLDGNIFDIIDYSSTEDYPEIIEKLENIVKFYGIEETALKDDWKRKKTGAYILEFPVEIKSLERKHVKSLKEIYCRVKDVDYDVEVELSDVVYNNLLVMWLLLVRILKDNRIEEYGQILPEISIPPEDIRFVNSSRVSKKITRLDDYLEWSL